MGLSFVRRFGGSGLTGCRARGLGGLGGQEQDGQEGPGRGDAAGDERTEGEAAQERVGGRVVQR